MEAASNLTALGYIGICSGKARRTGSLTPAGLLRGGTSKTARARSRRFAWMIGSSA